MRGLYLRDKIKQIVGFRSPDHGHSGESVSLSGSRPSIGLYKVEPLQFQTRVYSHVPDFIVRTVQLYYLTSIYLYVDHPVIKTNQSTI